MTFTEAAGTVGLAPEATSPAADEQFKQATEAFAHLSEAACRGAAGPSIPNTVDEAVQDFCFVAHFSQDDLWRSMTLLEKLRSCFGFGFAPIDAVFVPQETPLVVRTFSKSPTGRLTSVLVAPVDLEFVDADQRGDEYLLLLRPVEKAYVRARLERSVANGLSVEQACAKLAKALADASRAPLVGSRPWQGVAA